MLPAEFLGNVTGFVDGTVTVLRLDATFYRPTQPILSAAAAAGMELAVDEVTREVIVIADGTRSSAKQRQELLNLALRAAVEDDANPVP